MKLQKQFCCTKTTLNSASMNDGKSAAFKSKSLVELFLMFHHWKQINTPIPKCTGHLKGKSPRFFVFTIDFAIIRDWNCFLTNDRAFSNNTKTFIKQQNYMNKLFRGHFIKTCLKFTFEILLFDATDDLLLLPDYVASIWVFQFVVTFCRQYLVWQSLISTSRACRIHL